MTNKYLFVDFDGVFNAMDYFKHKRIWGDSKAIALKHINRTYPIIWSPKLVAEINKLNDTGVHVIWLTTWTERTAIFPEKFLFNGFPYVGHGRVDHSYNKTWWKYDVLSEWIAAELAEDPDALIGWVDDDLNFASDLHPRIKILIEKYKIHALVPDSRVGINPEQLEALKEFFA